MSRPAAHLTSPLGPPAGSELRGEADSERPGVEVAAEGLASVWRRRPSRVAVVVLVVGLMVTGALTWASLTIYENNENRLLGLRVKELGLVFTAALPSVQTPLASAAELADSTHGDAQRFKAFIAPYVGTGRDFASVSLWPLESSAPAPTVVVGLAPTLAARPTQARAFFAHVAKTPLLSLTGILGSGANRRLGYEYNTPGLKAGFGVYAEVLVPAGRRSKLQSNSGFADLNYGLYLGRSQRTADLLATNIQRFPITARTASEFVPFGDRGFTLVITPNGSLGGTFFERLPWAIAIVGVLLSLAAALMTDRLAHRRRFAEQLAGVLDRVADENRQMYTEQRGIAQTLQHALLPETLPRLPGLQTSARYIPATSGIDVGGDWYDIVAVDERRVLMLVGDVSGHGLDAATTMASLRYAALAYAIEEHRPASLLGKLSDFANSHPHAYFATVLCCLLEVDEHRLTLASAGHPAPLLIEGGAGRFLDVRVGVPIGVSREAPYEQSAVSVGERATLLAFTDGLIERRGEVLDTGMARLRAAATAESLALDALVTKLADDLVSEDHGDDTAIVALRWLS